MFTKLSFCFYTLIALFNLSYAGTAQVQSYLSHNSTLDVLWPIIKSDGRIDLEDLASVLKILLTKDQIITLVGKLTPSGIVIFRNDTICNGQDVPAEESKQVYENIMSGNISDTPLYELLHVPEMLSNATRIRRIENVIRSPRPIRPRRHVKKRHPSDVPGASPYVVLDQSIETHVPVSDSHSDDN